MGGEGSSGSLMVMEQFCPWTVVTGTQSYTVTQNCAHTCTCDWEIWERSVNCVNVSDPGLTLSSSHTRHPRGGRRVGVPAWPVHPLDISCDRPCSCHHPFLHFQEESRTPFLPPPPPIILSPL